MEVDSPIKDIIDAYNKCLRNINALQNLQDVEEVDPAILEKAIEDLQYQKDAKEWEEFKLKSAEERIAVIAEMRDQHKCYDCKMRDLGITLLRSLKENYGGTPKHISTEAPKDIKTEELIELLMLQAQNRDELNRGLMEEIATLRQKNSKMMADITNHLSEIVYLKKSLDWIKNTRCFNHTERMPF